jgi:hypothetical protein
MVNGVYFKLYGMLEFIGIAQQQQQLLLVLLLLLYEE